MAARFRLALVAALVVLIVGVGIAMSRRSDSPIAATSSSPSSASTVTTSSSTSTTSATTTTTVLPTTTTAPPIDWPALAGGPRALVTPTGVVLAVVRANADGTFVGRSPCGNEVTVAATPLAGANVVLDPGHGGDEPGAVGPAGTTEKAVNLAIALEAQRRLQALGATVVLTRTSDYRITLASRGAIATSLQPQLFVSIHHNAEPDEVRQTPGAEMYFQNASPASKRASGLLYEEMVSAFSAYDIDWGADVDAGAKYRLRGNGRDYYGILSRSAGVPAVLSEAAFISNPPEEALLADPAFQAVEAEAITKAIVRYVTTQDPGSGFVEPYPRTQPAGPGGGASGCTDPPLG